MRAQALESEMWARFLALLPAHCVALDMFCFLSKIQCFFFCICAIEKIYCQYAGVIERLQKYQRLCLAHTKSSTNANFSFPPTSSYYYCNNST